MAGAQRQKRGFTIGQTVYILESFARIRETVVLRKCGGMYTLRFANAVGGIRVREERLFASREQAEAEAVRHKKSIVNKPEVYCWHNVPLNRCNGYYSV